MKLAGSALYLTLTIFSAYTLYAGSIIGFIYGVPLGLISGLIVALTMGLVMALRNRHYAGQRTLFITRDRYKYTGESFTRETKWSEKMKDWFTPWSIFLDITLLYPVVIKRDSLSEVKITELRELLKK